MEVPFDDCLSLDSNVVLVLVCLFFFFLIRSKIFSSISNFVSILSCLCLFSYVILLTGGVNWKTESDLIRILHSVRT